MSEFEPEPEVVVEASAQERSPQTVITLGQVALKETVAQKQREMAQAYIDYCQSQGKPKPTYTQIADHLGVAASTGRQRCREIGYKSPKAKQGLSQKDIEAVAQVIIDEKNPSMTQIALRTNLSRHYTEQACNILGYESPQTRSDHNREVRDKIAELILDDNKEYKEISQEANISMSTVSRHTKHQDINYESPLLRGAQQKRSLVAQLIEEHGQDNQNVYQHSPEDLSESNTYYYSMELNHVPLDGFRAKKEEQKQQAFIQHLNSCIEQKPSYTKLSLDLNLSLSKIKEYCEQYGYQSPRHQRLIEIEQQLAQIIAWLTQEEIGPLQVSQRLNISIQTAQSRLDRLRIEPIKDYDSLLKDLKARVKGHSGLAYKELALEFRVSLPVMNRLCREIGYLSPRSLAGRKKLKQKAQRLINKKPNISYKEVGARLKISLGQAAGICQELGYRSPFSYERRDLQDFHEKEINQAKNLIEKNPEISYTKLGKELKIGQELAARICRYIGYYSPASQERRETKLESITQKVEALVKVDSKIHYSQIALECKIDKSKAADICHSIGYYSPASQERRAVALKKLEKEVKALVANKSDIAYDQIARKLKIDKNKVAEICRSIGYYSPRSKEGQANKLEVFKKKIEALLTDSLEITYAQFKTYDSKLTYTQIAREIGANEEITMKICHSIGYYSPRSEKRKTADLEKLKRELMILVTNNQEVSYDHIALRFGLSKNRAADICHSIGYYSPRSKEGQEAKLEKSRQKIKTLVTKDPKIAYAQIARKVGVDSSQVAEICHSIGYYSPRSNQAQELNLKKNTAAIKDTIANNPQASYDQIAQGTGIDKNQVAEICRLLGYHSPLSKQSQELKLKTINKEIKILVKKDPNVSYSQIARRFKINKNRAAEICRLIGYRSPLDEGVS